MSVNRASEVWKEIKPFAIRDMNRMLDNKAGDSGDDLYAIILYDESAQKIKYYSMSIEGLESALSAADSGDIIVVPAGELDPGYFEGSGETLFISDTSSKALSLWNGSGNDDPPTDWETEGFDDSGWGNALIITAGFSWDVVPGTNKIWPINRGDSAIAGEKALFRKSFELTSTNLFGIKLYIQADNRIDECYINGVYIGKTEDELVHEFFIDKSIINTESNNFLALIGRETSGNSAVFVSFKMDLISYADLVVPAGVELVGLGKNSVINGNIENNGIMTNIQVTGTISGSGITRLVPNPDAELFSNQIKSLVETGTSPFSIASTTVNTNLNADMLDGEHASAFADADHSHTESDITDLDHDAEKIDGIQVDLTGIEDLDTLVYDAYENKIIPGASGAGLSVGDLADVDLNALADGDILIFDETSGDWLPEPKVSGVTVEELDESPSVSNVTKIVLPNGSIVGASGGVVTVEFPEGGTGTGETDILMVQVFS